MIVRDVNYGQRIGCVFEVVEERFDVNYGLWV